MHSCVRCGGMSVCSVSHICRNLEIPWPTPSQFPWFLGYFHQWEQFGLLVSMGHITSMFNFSSRGQLKHGCVYIAFTSFPPGKVFDMDQEKCWTEGNPTPSSFLVDASWKNVMNVRSWKQGSPSESPPRAHTSEACPKAPAYSRKELGVQKVGFYLEKMPYQSP